MTEKKISAMGGQALIEGVMIKTKDAVSCAVRLPSGEIKTKREAHHSVTEKYWLLGLPFLRGIVFLFEMVVVGSRQLTWSANQQGEEEELGFWGTIVTFGLAILLVVVLFVLAPYYGAKFFAHPPSVLFNTIDGVLRLLIFFLYLYLIGLMADVKRMFMYHGAEHMAVHCYEAGLSLDVKNVRKFTPEHPRCGTSLLIYVIGVSIVVFSLVHFDGWFNILSRVLLIPIIGGISYELLKFAARFKNPFCKALTLPGMWTQKLTTRKPSDDQIEVAIAAVKKAL